MQRGHFARGALVLVATIMLASTACSPISAESVAPTETISVSMPRSYRFEPDVIQVPVGATVTWTNDDNFTHSVEMLDGSGRNPVVAPGQSTSLTFDTEGEFAYTCTFHRQQMNGKVIVGGR